MILFRLYYCVTALMFLLLSVRIFFCNQNVQAWNVETPGVKSNVCDVNRDIIINVFYTPETEYTYGFLYGCGI